MKHSLEKATSLLAVTMTLAAGGMAGEAAAETKPPISQKQARATRLADRITKELYSPNFPKGVPVPGILNGSVKIHTSIGNTLSFDSPVVLVESHSAKKTDTNGKLINGSWVGIPAHDAEGHVVLEPVQIKLGESTGESESLKLENRHDAVLRGAGIYATSAANGSDQLMGFDIQGNGGFPSVQISAEGMK